jgi:ABC-type oligopeptide transport system ATPase subunit
VIATMILVIAIDWRVGALLGVWFAGYLWYISGYLPRIRRRAMSRAAARAAVTGQVVDTITNMRTVKLFAHAEAEDEAAIRAMESYRDRTLDYGTISTSFRFGLMVIAGLLPVLLVGTALHLWTQGTATPGDIAATGTVALRIAQMTGWVSFALMGLYANVGEVEDGMNTLAHNHSMADAPGARPLPSAEGIRFDDVSFSYGREDEEEPGGGLRDLNLHIAPHEKIGLVGASGAGKSTLVALLLRLYDVEKGRVTVGGQDVRETTQESLRRAVGMVTQETAMFNRSARDNIRYGRPDATDEEVVAAARAARAHDFILQLEDFKGRRATTPIWASGREALGRPAPAHRARPRHAQGRAHPGARRGDLRPRLRGRGRDPGSAGGGHGRQDGDRHRAPPVHHRQHGPDRRHGCGHHRRGGHARGAPRPRRASTRATGTASPAASSRWRPRPRVASSLRRLRRGPPSRRPSRRPPMTTSPTAADLRRSPITAWAALRTAPGPRVLPARRWPPPDGSWRILRPSRAASAPLPHFAAAAAARQHARRLCGPNGRRASSAALAGQGIEGGDRRS